MHDLRIYTLTTLNWTPLHNIIPALGCMSVSIQTERGNMLFHLLYDRAPIACVNFLQQAASGSLNGCIAGPVKRGLLAQFKVKSRQQYGLGKEVETHDHPKIRRGSICLSKPGRNGFFVVLNNSHQFDPKMYTHFGFLVDGWEILDDIELHGGSIISANVHMNPFATDSVISPPRALEYAETDGIKESGVGR